MKHRRPFPERGRFVGRAFFGNFRTQNQGRAVKGNDSQHFVAPPGAKTTAAPPSAFKTHI